MEHDGGVSVRGTDSSGILIEGDGGVSVRGTDSSGILIEGDGADLARHVRTEAGVKKYHLPIGSLIVGHDYVPHPDDVVHKAMEDARKSMADAATTWANIEPGADLNVAKGKEPLAVFLDDAPVGTTIEVTPNRIARPSAVPGVVTYDDERGPRRVWTKVVGWGDDATKPHWESPRPEGSTDLADTGKQLIDAQWGAAEYRLPPAFGGDIDKVLHPKDGDMIAYRDVLNQPAEGTAMNLIYKDGNFHGFGITLSPGALLRRLTISADYVPGKATADYLFHSIDSDNLDTAFRKPVDQPAGSPAFVMPDGWAMSTPREAFAGDASMAYGYYARASRASDLRLFKGPHGEVAVVDDVSRGKFLHNFLSGVNRAMETVKNAPGIKDPHPKPKNGVVDYGMTRQNYTTFTVTEDWDGPDDALAFVRSTLADDVQVNPLLLDGTFGGGGSYKANFLRLTKVKPGGKSMPWWSPAEGLASENLFTGTLTHELGHVNDERLADTGHGMDAKPEAISFWNAHKNLSEYGNTNAAEGYAEAFAEWFSEQRLTPEQRATLPEKVRSIAAAYAEKYGWTEEPHADPKP